MDIRDTIKAANRRHVVAYLDPETPLVFEIKRLRPIDLASEGLAELPGATLPGIVAEQTQDKIVREQQLAAAGDDEEKIAALRARWERDDEERQRRVMEAVSKDLDASLALLDRFRAWTCAAVCRVGLYVGTVEEPDPPSPGLHGKPIQGDKIHGFREVKFSRTPTGDDMDVTEIDLCCPVIAQAVMQLTYPNPSDLEPFRGGRT